MGDGSTAPCAPHPWARGSKLKWQLFVTALLCKCQVRCVVQIPARLSHVCFSFRSCKTLFSVSALRNTTIRQEGITTTSCNLPRTAEGKDGQPVLASVQSRSARPVQSLGRGLSHKRSVDCHGELFKTSDTLFRAPSQGNAGRQSSCEEGTGPLGRGGVPTGLVCLMTRS